jgi:two-component system KDP operon response regulator KdpE
MNASRPSVLVIDDEIQMRRMLRISLEGAGYRVWEAESGEQGLVETASRKPEIILLDLSLPDMEGINVLRRLREWHPLPVLILSVRESEEEKVKALDAGADDYVTKPFHTDELLARIRVALRHSSPREPVQVFEQNGLVVDLVQRTVKIKGQSVELTPTEYSLLRLLVVNAGKILTHAHILREIWGPKSGEQSQYLRVYVSQLRAKLTAAGGSKEMIKTESGVGYRLQVET